MSSHHRTTGPSPEQPAGPPSTASEYEIRVAGRLPSRWSAWFDGLAVVPADDGSTVLRGRVVDQAALHGLLQKLRDIGIPLLSLARVPTSSAPPDPVARPARRRPEGDQP